MATPQPLPPQPFQIDLWTILCESKRITKAHSRHFLALSVLFLLPLAFSFSVYPYIYQLFSESSAPTVETHLSFLFLPYNQQSPIPLPTKPIIFSAVYALFVLIFTSLAAGSITYSVFHGFYGRPVKLVSALKSALTSFPRLLSTYIVSELIVSLLFLLLALILFAMLKTIEFLGFQIHYTSPKFTILLLFFLVIFLCFVIYLQVNWIFAPVVAVVESSWGLKSLKRSKYLVKGTRWVSLSMLLFYGFLSGILGWLTSARWDDSSADDQWKNWLFVLHIVWTSTCYLLILLSNFAATTVFYMYSKAIHGELAWEIAQEFATEYVSLPFDDGKVPHVVSVVYG